MIRLKTAAFPVAIYVSLTTFALLLFAHGQTSGYVLVVFIILSVQLIASFSVRTFRASRDEIDQMKVAIVVPFYNEDVAFFSNMLDSLARQTRMPNSIWLIDDGSSSIDCFEVANAWASTIPDATVVRRAHEGKRRAIALAFRSEPDADIFVTIDSDTVLDVNAISEGLKPFTDSSVMAATGVVLARNSQKNLLTRLIEVRYANAFLLERASYSLLGSVLCTCGALAFYRAEVIREHLDDFTNQKFLGKRAMVGEDRRLTNYALSKGRAVLQSSSAAHTAVPERLGHFARQQIRWNKSFIRESLWAVQNLPIQRPAIWLALTQLTSWLIFPPIMVFVVLSSSLKTNFVLLCAYLVWTTLISYARSVRFLDRSTRQASSRWWISYLICPLYGVMHIVLLTPLRWYALATIRVNSWGTRQTVEVAGKLQTEG